MARADSKNITRRLLLAGAAAAIPVSVTAAELAPRLDLSMHPDESII